MSFVYAEKRNTTINIHCDTKIVQEGIFTVSSEQRELIQKYGIVKSTVISPMVSISFAGNNIFLASKLFLLISEMKQVDTRQIIDMAYYIHKTGKVDDIEFIIASCEDGLSIYCVKEYEIQEDCQFAWIGSPIAHREFQEIRNRNNTGNASDRTDSAFLQIVQGCSDRSVGGFHIVAGYNSYENSMGYKECKTYQSSKPSFVKSGAEIPFFTKAEDGGFSFEQIPISNDELLLRIDQMEPMILYSRRLRLNNYDKDNPQLFSFMLPMLVRVDRQMNLIRI